MATGATIPIASESAVELIINAVRCMRCCASLGKYTVATCYGLHLVYKLTERVGYLHANMHLTILTLLAVALHLQSKAQHLEANISLVTNETSSQRMRIKKPFRISIQKSPVKNRHRLHYVGVSRVQMLFSNIIVNACLYDTSTTRVLYKMHSFKVVLAYTKSTPASLPFTHSASTIPTDVILVCVCT